MTCNICGLFAVFLPEEAETNNCTIGEMVALVGEKVQWLEAFLSSLHLIWNKEGFLDRELRLEDSPQKAAELSGH